MPNEAPADPPARIAAAALLFAFAAGALLWGCDTARILAPPPPVRAASAATYAVDVEFAEPLDRSSAQDPSHYVLYPVAAPSAPVSIASATLVDTLYGRVVQLLVPAWLGDPAIDGVDVTVETHGVRDLNGHSTGNRSVTFRTGLGYVSSMQALFDGRCSGCHGAARVEGNYRTDSYAALFGNGVAPPADIIAGDPNCLTVIKCKPRNSMFNDGNLSYLDFEMIRNWVSIYSARP